VCGGIILGAQEPGQMQELSDGVGGDVAELDAARELICALVATRW
jgi:hypothetical protein